MTKRAFLAVLACLLFLLVMPISAQQQPAELRIINTDTSALPSVDITLLAKDADGDPIDLSNEFIAVQHNGEPVEDVAVNGTTNVGTFTMFLLDLPPGVVGEIDNMKRSIQAYTTTDFMQEQSDYVAVYRVDEGGATEMQAPTFFYNDVINLFTRGIETQPGATALLDSIGDLLTRAENLQPRDGMATSLVVFSDGTDSVSNQFTDSQLYGLARDKGIKIYTVLVENTDLVFSSDDGRQFMENMAAQTSGDSVLLPDLTGTKIMWSDITAFSQLPVVRYTPSVLEAGTASVQVSLPNYPEVAPVSTSVTVPATLPQIAIDVSEEARTLSVDELVTPVSLGLPTTISWLDDVPREVTQAQLWVNGQVLSDIDPATVSRVTADVPLNFGENALQVVIVDSEGQTAKSPPLMLMVEQGDRSIPREIRAGSAIPWRIILYIAICILIIALLIYLFNRLRRRAAMQGTGQTSYGGWRKRMEIAREERKRKRDASAAPARTDLYPDPGPTSVEKQVGHTYTSPEYGGTTQVSTAVGRPSIEVLDARSSIATKVPVNRSEFLIGRSPTVDLALTEDATVSRIHATIVEDNGLFRIYDEQSTSGTYVNDREVPEYGLQLSDGDEIHIGAVHLRFRAV